MAKVREKILDAVFGASKSLVLNGQESTGGMLTALPQRIAESVLALKKAAIITRSGVDYAALIHSNAYKEFSSTIAVRLREFDPDELKTQAEKLAFWINLYNLLTLHAVIAFGIKKSGTGRWTGEVRFFRQAAYDIHGERYSLEDIEHGILRGNRGVSFLRVKQFSGGDKRLKYMIKNFDVRIHFALSCASKSCPPIAFYSPERIDVQLDMAAVNFINSEVKLDKSGVMLRIPRIFKWYQRDFGGREGMLAVLEHYLPAEDMRRALIENFGYEVMVKYAPYDWHLNILI